MADETLTCPHCQGCHLPTAQLPKEVVVVVPCPACSELAVMFRKKVVPIDRNLLQGGTRRQRILHIAEIITEFIDSGVVPEANNILLGDNLPFLAGGGDIPPGKVTSAPNLISDEEFAQFRANELRALDNPASFRKIFG